MSDRTELELALSVAEMAANGILEEWEGLDEDGKEDPSNKMVHELATQTLKVVNEYRNNLDKMVHELEQEIDQL